MVLMKTQDKSEEKSGSRPKHWSLQVFYIIIVGAVIQDDIQHQNLFFFFKLQANESCHVITAGAQAVSFFSVMKAASESDLT